MAIVYLIAASISCICFATLCLTAARAISKKFLKEE